jgi:hypothetical protein
MRPARFLAERSTSRYGAPKADSPIRRANGGDLNDLIDFFVGESI